ncbi:unnamed protein product [Urochloa humidicola]
MSPSPSPPCNGELMMAIGSYSEAKKLGKNGSYYRCRPVDIGGHSWSVAFYPDGEVVRTTATDYMSLFLMLDDVRRAAAAGGAGAGEDEDIQVKFRLVMHEEGCGGTAAAFTSDEVAAAFTRRRNVHGFERFRISIKCSLGGREGS